MHGQAFGSFEVFHQSICLSPYIICILGTTCQKGWFYMIISMIAFAIESANHIYMIMLQT
jgi:hypothetical protein